MIFSRIFEKQKKTGKTEIGLLFPKSESPPFLNEGITLAVFNSSGKVPFCNETLNIWSKDLCKLSKDFLITLKLTLL